MQIFNALSVALPFTSRSFTISAPSERVSPMSAKASLRAERAAEARRYRQENLQNAMRWL